MTPRRPRRDARGRSSAARSRSTDPAPSAPLTEAAADIYKEEQPGVQVTVGTSGTGGGFEKFCNGETDISDASRPIKDDGEGGVRGQEHHATPSCIVANDALTVVVQQGQHLGDCLTVAQLKKIWDQGSTVTNWNQVDPAFPNEPLGRTSSSAPAPTPAPSTTSPRRSTARRSASRTDYTASENDNVLVQGVAGTKGALGYFGFSYYEENPDKLKAAQGRRRRRLRRAERGDRAGRHLQAAVPAAVHLRQQQALPSQAAGASTSSTSTSTNIDEIAEEAKFVPLTAEQKTDSRPPTRDTFKG